MLRFGDCVDNRFVIGRALTPQAPARTFEVWDRVDQAARILKLLPDHSAVSLRPRFDLIAGLRHPNISRLFSLGSTASGSDYIVEELLHAVPFDAIAWSTSDTSLLLEAVYQVLVGLDTLHQQGLVHGNIKPSNLLVAAPRPFEGASPEERFRELSMERSVRICLSDIDLRPNNVAVPSPSPAYAAPEAFHRLPDARSDLYSLAVVLFEALTGQLPFPDARELLRSDGVLPNFPSPAVSEPLSRFVRRLGSTRAEDRMESAAEGMANLEQGLRLAQAPLRVQSFRLIDRSAELGALGSALGKLKEGHGSVLIIEGDEGVGKRRLVEELRGLTQLSGIRALNRPFFETAASAAQLLGPGAGAVSLAGKNGLELSALIVRRLLAEARTPTVLLCWDLHHADRTLDATLSLLSRSIQDIPLLVVGTSCRPMELPAGSRISISGLRGDSLSEFICDATGAASALPGFVERLLSITSGRPLLIVQALDLLVRSGWLSRRLGRWNFETEELPASAYERIVVDRPEDLFERHIDSLFPEDIRALAALYILRNESPRPADLEFLLGRPVGTIDSRCDAQLVSRFTNVALPSACRMLGSVAYARLSASQRGQLHERAYELLSGRESRPAVLAWHLVKTAGPRRAVPLLLEAADQAYRDGSVRACTENLRTAASLLDPAPERSAILERLSDRLVDLGEPEAAEEVLREALMHPTATRPVKFARLLFSQGRAEDARNVLEALDLAESLEEVDRLTLLGEILFSSDDEARGRWTLRRAEELARRHGDRVRLGRVLIELGNDHVRAGELDHAVEFFSEALAIFRADGMPKMQAICLNALGLCSYRLGRWDSARVSLGHSIEIQESLGALDKVLSSRTNLGQLCSQTGRWDEAERQYRAALDLSRRIDSSPSQRIRGLCQLALLLARRDNSEEALTLLEKATALAAEQGQDLHRASVLGSLGELHLLEGRDHEAESCFKRSLELARTIGAEDLEAESLRRLAELLFEQGWFSDALACCREARLYFHTAENALEIAQCDRLLGKIYAQQGEFKQSLAVLDSAISAMRASEARYQLGLALLSRGLTLSKSGFDERAVETLEEAIAIFRELGAPRDLHHAEALLRSLGSSHELVEVRHLRLLLSVVGKLNRSLDLKQMLEQILDCVLELTGASRGLLMLESPEGEVGLQIARSQRREDLDPRVLDISQSVVQRVRTHRRSIVITDINDNAVLRQRESIVRLGLRSVMCVPLVVESRMMGLIYVDDQSTSDNFYTRTDLGLLEAFAAQAALAIDKAQLHAQLKNSYADLQASQSSLEGAYTRLQAIQLSLSHAEKMTVLGSIASSIAHDLNQPLTYLTSMIEVNLDRADSRTGDLDRLLARVTDVDLRSQLSRFLQAERELRADLPKALTTIEQMSDIVKGVHRYSKKASTAPTRFLLREPLEDALRILEHQLKVDGIHVIKLLEPGIEIVANSSQLMQVFMNLLGNARDAMVGQADRRLTIETTSEGDSVRIRISDTGAGIDPLHKDRIFEPFFTTKSQHGTGLGLSIVKDIVEQHGGSIRMQSQPGAGTHVTLRLPLHKK